MVEQGLQPQHVFFDIGCGSLRGGVRIIRYLDFGNYLGFDISQQLIDIGIRHELGSQLYEIKRPEFAVSDAFEFNLFSKQPDFALTQAVFPLLAERDILLCLSNLRGSAKIGTKFYATFSQTNRPCGDPQCYHPHLVFSYTRDQMIEFGDISGWEMRYIGDWGHPRGQMMVEYSIKS